jgi:hypothetical protein
VTFESYKKSDQKRLYVIAFKVWTLDIIGYFEVVIGPIKSSLDIITKGIFDI